MASLQTARSITDQKTTGRSSAARSPRWTLFVFTGNLLFGIVITIAAILTAALTILPRLLEYQTYVVLTGSMTPTIPVGSVVIVVPTDPKAIREGDVISFTRMEAGKEPITITHRVKRVILDAPSDVSFETQGDANAVPDGLPVRYLGQAGKVVTSVPLVGHFFLFGRSPLGRILFLTVPGLALLCVWMWSIWAPKKPVPAGRRIP